jgi:hypothetical protein
MLYVIAPAEVVVAEARFRVAADEEHAATRNQRHFDRGRSGASFLRIRAPISESATEHTAIHFFTACLFLAAE